ncbi:MAG: hypothetical protein WC637_16885 [Victivallales bacterium]|jgi:hypothetical protein
MMPKYNRDEWAVKYDSSINLDELETRLERSQYYRKIGEADRQFVHMAFIMNFVASYLMGVFFTVILLFLMFLPWMLPIMLIRGCFR